MWYYYGIDIDNCDLPSHRLLALIRNLQHYLRINAEAKVTHSALVQAAQDAYNAQVDDSQLLQDGETITYV